MSETKIDSSEVAINTLVELCGNDQTPSMRVQAAEILLKHDQFMTELFCEPEDDCRCKR